MLRSLPLLREAQKLFHQNSLVHKPSFEQSLEKLYQPQYDITGPVIYHQRELRFGRHRPYISNVMTYVSQNCVLIGDVEIGRLSIILPNSVIRAETTRSAIGDNVFIGENSLIVQSPLPFSSTHDGSFMIGDGVAIGPNCILRGCTIEPHAFVGEGCQILDGATVETCSVLLSGSVLPEGAVVKEDEIWGGAPAQFIRKTTEEEQQRMYAWIMDQYQVFNKLRVQESDPQTLSRYFSSYWDNILRASTGEQSRYERPRFHNDPPSVYITDLRGEGSPSRSIFHDPLKKFQEKYKQ